jgi:hypothetical protein
LREIAYIAEHKKRIQQRLKDPEAAQFRNVYVHYSPAPVVCGEINGTNSFGDRTGFQRFISAANLQVLERTWQPGNAEGLVTALPTLMAAKLFFQIGDALVLLLEIEKYWIALERRRYPFRYPFPGRVRPECGEPPAPTPDSPMNFGRML